MSLLLLGERQMLYDRYFGWRQKITIAALIKNKKIQFKIIYSELKKDLTVYFLDITINRYPIIF